MRRANFLLVLIITAIFAFTASAFADVVVSSHAHHENNIHYSMYNILDDNGVKMSEMTVWVDLKGNIHKENGWKFPYNENKSIYTDKDIMKKFVEGFGIKQDNNSYSQDTYQVFLNLKNKIKFNINSKEDGLYVSGNGIVQISNLTTGKVIINNAQIKGKEQRINLPNDLEKNVPYMATIHENNGETHSIKFFLTENNIQAKETIK